jgi:osmotically-inducible protein OsmY
MRPLALAQIVVVAASLAVPPFVVADVPCPKTVELSADSADRRATDEIRRRIEDDQSVSARARRIAVSTSDGVVTLRGEVEDAQDRMELGSLAEGVEGVRRVEDRLEVRH